MVLPVVRLVGSDPTQLFEGWLKASHALADAMSSLNEVAPHGRDYPNFLATAMEEHRSRIDRLRSLKDEVDAVVECLTDSIMQRKNKSQNSV